MWCYTTLASMALSNGLHLSETTSFYLFLTECELQYYGAQSRSSVSSHFLLILSVTSYTCLEPMLEAPGAHCLQGSELLCLSPLKAPPWLSSWDLPYPKFPPQCWSSSVSALRLGCMAVFSCEKCKVYTYYVSVFAYILCFHKSDLKT